MEVSTIHGFNYQGSWGTSGLDLWQHHDHGRMAFEVAGGKRCFPGWNAVRWWLSHEAFQRAPDCFLANLDAGLSIFSQNSIAVMPVLFNRWRDPVCDWGGVPHEHLLPGVGIYTGKPGDCFLHDGHYEGESSVERLFEDYLESVIGAFGGDERVFAWDLCNEPLHGPYVEDPDSPVRAAELTWLSWCASACRRLGATQPLTIGNWANLTAVAITEPLCDVISFHPYWMWNRGRSKSDYETLVDSAVSLSRAAGKQLIASETVWGAVEDARRAEVVQFEMGVLKERGVGVLAYALHHSLIADLRQPGYGPVGVPGCLEFIRADGTLRPGHDAFNAFA